MLTLNFSHQLHDETHQLKRNVEQFHSSVHCWQFLNGMVTWTGDRPLNLKKFSPKCLVLTLSIFI